MNARRGSSGSLGGERAETTRALLEATGARELVRGARIQPLWSGYGEIFRARLPGFEPEQVVIKRVSPPAARRHPRGWSTDRGHARKLRSYEVERAFYERWAPRLPASARVGRCFASGRDDAGWWFVLEDLDRAGFPLRRAVGDPPELKACLRWLAAFHATFLDARPEGLWAQGTYWHLDTRPDELAAIEDPELARAAPHLDARLKGCRFPTVVHGDAKLANFCFSPTGAVAGVDFQYAGGGAGMKDVAYLLSCVEDEGRLEAEAEGLLDVYFDALRVALAGRDLDLDAVEAEGRALYPVAWADFTRFLAGWAPEHWKRHAYGRRLTREGLDALR